MTWFKSPNSVGGIDTATGGELSICRFPDLPLSVKLELLVTAVAWSDLM